MEFIRKIWTENTNLGTINREIYQKYEKEKTLPNGETKKTSWRRQHVVCILKDRILTAGKMRRVFQMEGKSLVKGLG